MTGEDTTKRHVDVDLVRRSRSGDVQAFEQLFNRYQKTIYNLVYGMVGNEGDAAEITQDVFVRAFGSIKLLKADEAFFTWLKTIAVNICRDHARKRPPARVESLDQKIAYDGEELAREIVDTSAGPATILEKKQVSQAVRRAMDSLSPDHKQVVILHHIADMDLRDIAKSLGCPVGTVKSRLARARDELRRKLAPFVES